MGREGGGDEVPEGKVLLSGLIGRLSATARFELVRGVASRDVKRGIRGNPPVYPDRRIDKGPQYKCGLIRVLPSGSFRRVMDEETALDQLVALIARNG